MLLFSISVELQLPQLDALQKQVDDLKNQMAAGFLAIQKNLNLTKGQLEIPTLQRLIDVETKVTDVENKVTALTKQS